MLTEYRHAIRLESIQIMRALAALAICFEHLSYDAKILYEAEWTHLPQRMPLTIGVDLFFIISGFIMMHVMRDKFGALGAARQFIVKRLIRIVPPYWFFTTLLLFAGIIAPAVLKRVRITFPHVVLSYLFIPHLDPADPNSIHPFLALGWTLLYEMFFYVCFAAAVAGGRRWGLRSLVIAFVVVFIAARFGCWNSGLNLFWGDSILFEFLFGVFLYRALVNYHPGVLWRVAFGATAVAWILLCRRYAVSERLVTQGGPALLIFIALFRISPPALIGESLAKLGDASYTLYLSHGLVIGVRTRVANYLELERFGANMASLVYVGGSLVTCVGFAEVFYRWCEKPVTNRLMRLITRRKVGT